MRGTELERRLCARTCGNASTRVQMLHSVDILTFQLTTYIYFLKEVYYV